MYILTTIGLHIFFFILIGIILKLTRDINVLENEQYFIGCALMSLACMLFVKILFYMFGVLI